MSEVIKSQLALIQHDYWYYVEQLTSKLRLHYIVQVSCMYLPIIDFKINRY